MKESFAVGPRNKTSDIITLAPLTKMSFDVVSGYFSGWQIRADSEVKGFDALGKLHISLLQSRPAMENNLYIALQNMGTPKNSSAKSC